MLDKLKTLLIFLLTLLMAALLTVSLTLGVQTEAGVFTYLGSLYFQTAGAGQEGESSLQPEPAAFPSRIAVTNAAGVYSAWGEEDYSRLYSVVSGIYSEALGSIGTPEAIDERQFTLLHSYPSIRLDFGASLSLYMHYAWTGSGEINWADSGKPVKSVVIGMNGGAVALAFYSGNGEYFLAQTGTSASRLQSVCDSVADSPNSEFAFQNERFANLSPRELVYSGTLELPVFGISTPDYVGEGELPRQVLEAFSIRHYLAGFFVSGTGAIQYAEGTAELTVGLSGELIYTNSSLENPIGVGFAPGSPAHAAQAVERAREIVTDIWGKTGSPGRLSLDLLEFDSGVYYIGFEAQLGGLCVELEPRPAYVIIENGCIAAVNVRPRLASETGSEALPYTQLAAAAESGDGHVCVVYAARGGTVRPQLATVEDDG